MEYKGLSTLEHHKVSLEELKKKLNMCLVQISNCRKPICIGSSMG